MVRHSQIALFEAAPDENSRPEALWQSRAGDDVHGHLSFLLEFNRDLDRNAQLTRLNEKYLERITSRSAGTFMNTPGQGFTNFFCFAQPTMQTTVSTPQWEISCSTPGSR